MKIGDLVDKILSLLPFKFEISANVTYDKKEAKHTLRIETDELEVCRPKIEKKGRLFQHLFAIHLLPDNTFNIEEIGKSQNGN